jgi:purine-binding chemotaxis protein CheW
VIDQRRRFATNAASDSKRPRVMVLTIGQLQAGFIVDGVAEIMRLAPSSIAPAPDMPGEATRIFDRVATSDDGGMILLVDPAQLLDRAERDLLDHFAAAEGSALMS